MNNDTVESEEIQHVRASLDKHFVTRYVIYMPRSGLKLYKYIVYSINVAT